MQFLTQIPQRLDSAASPTFAGALLGDGSAAAPSIAFSSETSLGFSMYSTGNIRFSSFGLNTWVLGRNASLATLFNPTGGGGITANDSGNVAITASGTNQNITLTPSTTGVVLFNPAYYVRMDAQSGTDSVFQYYKSGVHKWEAGVNSADAWYLRNASSGTQIITLDAQTFSLAGTTVNYNGNGAGAANSSTRFRKAVTAIANAVATGVLTVTIPNAAHSAQLNVYLTGSLGAGGAIGANEATGVIGYSFAITRTAGVNAVVTASSAFGSATASVAGGATITITAAASAISGAVGATNTFTVNVTISRGTGTSTNHTCQITAELDNANASGITLA